MCIHQISVFYGYWPELKAVTVCVGQIMMHITNRDHTRNIEGKILEL